MNRSRHSSGNGNFDSIDLNLSSHLETVNHVNRLGSQLDTSIDSIDFIPKSPDKSIKPSPAKSNNKQHRKNNLTSTPITIPHFSPRAGNSEEIELSADRSSDLHPREAKPQTQKQTQKQTQIQTQSRKINTIAERGGKRKTKNGASNDNDNFSYQKGFDSSIDNLPKTIRNIAQTQKDHGIVLSSGNFKCQERLLAYEIRKVMNYVLSVNINVPETNQKWSFMITYLDEIEDLIKIWERQKKLFSKGNIHKLNLWILSNLSIEFEDFLITSVDLKLEEFRKKVMRELAFIIYSATVTIQKFVRGYRIRKAYKKIIKAIRVHNVNASKVNTRLFGDVFSIKQKISTHDLLSANGKYLGPYRQNSVGALVLEAGRRQNSNSNLLHQISPGRLHGQNSNSNLSPGRLHGQNSNSHLPDGLDENEANLLMQHRKVVYDPQTGQYTYEHGVAGDNRENRETAIGFIKQNRQGRYASQSQTSEGYGAAGSRRQSNRSPRSQTQKTSAVVSTAGSHQRYGGSNMGSNNNGNTDNNNAELSGVHSNKASVTIRKDLAKVKSDITGALSFFQNQLESLHEIINTKQLRQGNGNGLPNLTKDELQAFEEYKKSDKIASYVSQMSNVNNVNVLKNELADVAAKLDNMENLYILQSENANEIERSAKIEIAKARLVADKVSERAAERVRGELTFSYEQKLKNQFEAVSCQSICQSDGLV